jgi:ABC-type transporter Mla subunit MlaD
MADIHSIREQLESAQSNLESASWDADQASDNARDAVRNADEALSIVTAAIEDLEDLVGYSKYEVDQAMRHLRFIEKVHTMYLERLENLIDGNPAGEKHKFTNVVGLLETLTTINNGALEFDSYYNVESFYDNNEFGYKTVKKQEVSNG